MHDRNHEGYHDPTACMAIRSVMRGQARAVLTYRIGEAMKGQAGGGRHEQRGAGGQGEGRDRRG